MLENSFLRSFQEFYENENTSLEIFESNTRNDYLGFYLKGFQQEIAHLTAWQDQNRIGAFLVIRKTASDFIYIEMFEKLYQHKEVIEGTWDVEDEWQWIREPPFNNRGPMIGFYRTKTNDQDDFRWMMDRLEMLDISFFMTMKTMMKRSRTIRQIDSEDIEIANQLRDSNNLIECKAIVEYESGINWQPSQAVIDPININQDGYVEEVWIYANDFEQVEFGRDKYLLLTTLPISINWIDRFDISGEQSRTLYPIYDLRIKYIISSPAPV